MVERDFSTSVTEDDNRLTGSGGKEPRKLFKDEQSVDNRVV
jgi:hypothetical protein